MTKKIVPIRSGDLFAAMRRDGSELIKAEKRLGSKMILARNLMRLRIQRGMTQSALAKAAGISQPRIAEMESARANPQLETLERLCSALGVDLESLVKKKHAERGRKVSVQASMHLTSTSAGTGWDNQPAVEDVFDVISHFDGSSKIIRAEGTPLDQAEVLTGIDVDG